MFSISAFLTYIFVVTYTPGPNNIMSMAHASQYGFKKTLHFMFGVMTGVFFIILASNYFTLFLFNVIPKIKTFMGLVGAGYMTYLAVKIMKSSSSHEKKEQSFLKYTTGIMLQFVNPKFILYAITVTSSFIVPYFNKNYQILLFSGLLAIIAFSSLALWAAFGTLFNRFLSQYSKPFSITMGLLLLYSAFSISGIAQFIH